MQEAPRVLVGQVLGWELDVHWLAEWSALRALERVLTSVSETSEALTLEELRAARCHGLPVANQVIRSLGWQLQCHERALCRIDDSARTRIYRMGVDSPRILRGWLVDHHKLQATASCGRIVKSQHRLDPTLAVGLSLPAPCPNKRFAFLGHQTVYNRAAKPLDRHAALATACNSWFLAKRMRLTGDVRCLCGMPWPSRTHLLWTCPALAEQRPEIAQPVDRVAERLCGAPLREFPPPPPCGAVEGKPLGTLLQEAVKASPRQLVLATDGSSQDEVGAYAIVSDSPKFVYVGDDDSEDQSPFRMELLALVVLLTAVAALERPPDRLLILVDCESAIQAMGSPGTCNLRILAHKAFAAVRTLRLRGTTVHPIWVPSHGKQPRWKPSLQLDPVFCRYLNEQADSAARRIVRSVAAVPIVSSGRRKLVKLKTSKRPSSVFRLWLADCWSRRSHVQHQLSPIAECKQPGLANRLPEVRSG